MRSKVALAAFALVVVASGAVAQSTPQTYGTPFTVDSITPLADILAHPAAFVGKEVRTQGYVYRMCEDSGCWLGVLPRLDASQMVKISWIQTDVRFPIGPQTTGRAIELQGVLISAEQEAEEHVAHMIEEGEDPAAHTEEHAEEMAPHLRTIYLCPDHPDVMSEKPGACPESGTALVAKEVPVPEFASVAINGTAAVILPPR